MGMGAVGQGVACTALQTQGSFLAAVSPILGFCLLPEPANPRPDSAHSSLQPQQCFPGPMFPQKLGQPCVGEGRRLTPVWAHYPWSNSTLSSGRGLRLGLGNDHARGRTHGQKHLLPVCTGAGQSEHGISSGGLLTTRGSAHHPGDQGLGSSILKGVNGMKGTNSPAVERT